MAKCPTYTVPIRPSENIGDSLLKINNNFYNLQTELFNIKEILDTTIQTRTFFYYGFNASENPTSDMQDGVTSRPSNTTIENFVNNANQLNVCPISNYGDQVYVIYQKTGYYNNPVIRTTRGTALAVGTVGRYYEQLVDWSTTTPEKLNTYSLIFIIWLLTYDGNKYNVTKGFPKFSQAETLSSPDWNNPMNWKQY
jgi:hypothetical protein